MACCCTEAPAVDAATDAVDGDPEVVTQPIVDLILIMIPHGTRQLTATIELWPARLAVQKALDPNYFRQTSLLIARPFSGSLKRAVCMALFLAEAFPPTHTFNVAHLTLPQ